MNALKLVRDAKGEPKGVITQSPDGRVFFIPEDTVEALLIPDSTLFAAFRLSSGHRPPAHANRSKCARVKRWLDTHSPNTAYWRSVCISYFNEC
jgi:hypothetical protein